MTTQGDKQTAPAEPVKPAAIDTARPVQSIAAIVRDWWSGEVAADINHSKVLLRIAEESSTTARYLFMTCMSAGIAVLGLLLSSPAVVIGAMLLSPLMGPILGAGFALAEGKFKWLRLCARAILIGTVVSILFTAAIVWLSPLQTVTDEIAARTRPNLFDLLVALFSSLAGSYAMIRGREGTIVGVAIATALMPPLAVVGYGLATFNMTVFGGALLLYVTNLLTIALTATVMARLYGFRYKRSAQHGMTESAGILLTFVLLAIPLGISLTQIAREANGQRIVNSVIEDSFDPLARVEQPVIDWDADPIQISAYVYTPEFESDADEQIKRRLTNNLGEDVAVTINQFRVGTDPGAAEQAQLARAREQQQAAAAEQQVASLTERLALISGVPPSDVTIDRENRRALVSAKPLDGLSLAGYRALEMRAAAQAPDWEIRLRPPILGLPNIELGEDGPSEAGKAQLELVSWAASRTGIPIVLSGADEATTAIVQSLTEAGVAASGETVSNTRNNTDVVTARWSTQ
ncbi:DUF389 domain-containing protein [Erythrobacter sp. W53]|uniref:DUF389 domain-containing protein n=1 Tax=Erythrobacter sp. W53 TaxID=3425947 RepID=UPI003D76A164